MQPLRQRYLLAIRKLRSVTLCRFPFFLLLLFLLLYRAWSTLWALQWGSWWWCASINIGIISRWKASAGTHTLRFPVGRVIVRIR
uniref:Putative secreted protein n=1 Tax=Anopheles darlingi TaxID=43151 RepID=A0A2M4DNL1_ANODA